jgi:hypothetical protein
MKVLLLSDGETWETYELESDACIIELLNVPDDPDMEDIEAAIEEQRYEVVNYLWDMA